jgi:hypothetical protein
MLCAGARNACRSNQHRRKNMNPKIIAIDFDGCLVTNMYPEIGEPINETIDMLIAEQKAGAKVILWTCRQDDKLRAAVQWSAKHGIYLDAINENLPERIKFFGGDTRKVFADEYWDDRAVKTPPASRGMRKTRPRNEFYEDEQTRDTQRSEYCGLYGNCKTTAGTH